MNYSIQQLTFQRDLYSEMATLRRNQMTTVTAASLAAFLDDLLNAYAERDALAAELELLKAGAA